MLYFYIYRFVNCQQQRIIEIIIPKTCSFDITKYANYKVDLKSKKYNNGFLM